MSDYTNTPSYYNNKETFEYKLAIASEHTIKYTKEEEGDYSIK